MLSDQYGLLEYCTREKLTGKKKRLWKDQKEKLEHKVADSMQQRWAGKKGFICTVTTCYNKQFKGAFSSWGSSRGLSWLSLGSSRKESWALLLYMGYILTFLQLHIFYLFCLCLLGAFDVSSSAAREKFIADSASCVLLCGTFWGPFHPLWIKSYLLPSV